MDASETTREMGTSVPAEVVLFADKVARGLDASVYLTGGALQPRKAEDYDLLVKSKQPKGFCTACIEELKNSVFTLRYNESYNGQEGAWDAVWSVEYEGYKIDILLVPTRKSLIEVLGEYPLSIQKQALWMAGPTLYRTPLVRHDNYCVEPIVAYEGGTALKKYMDYFPDEAFLLLPNAMKHVKQNYQIPGSTGGVEKEEHANILSLM